ncbi:MAG: PolyA polymerase, partial [candidate division CPR3 bacterium GW2011_GWE2_35_7]
MNHQNLLYKIPPEILKVINDLKTASFEAYLVGGCVRDLLLNNPPKDYDIATNAKPEEISKVFPESVTTYAKFGTVLVLTKDEHKETHPVEVTTYRSEMDYRDGRWPMKVEFTSKLSKDLGRRDFTINALAMEIKDNETDIIDLFNGVSDLHKGVIRAVGTPQLRMEEDGLRGFRACRLASTLEFEVEGETFSAISKAKSVSAQVSVERIRDEFIRLLMESHKPSIGIELLRRTGLLELFLPELLEGIGVTQPEYHVDDVYHHLLACVDVALDELKLAALFHDIGKPRVKNVEFEQKYLQRLLKKGKVIPKHHFFGHDEESARMTEEILVRMKFPKVEIKKTVSLVRWHMFYYQDEWSDGAVRRFIKRVGGEENVDLLFKLRIADADSNPKSEFTPAEIQKLEERIAEVRAKEMILSVNDLAINGKDLMGLGVPEGPIIGQILQHLLKEVIEDPILNEREKLLSISKNQIKN